MVVLNSPQELQTLVGQEVGVSDWLAIPQGMIDAFADVTGDRQWIHCDASRAKSESPYGVTVAHGFLTLALLSRLHSESLTIKAGRARTINYGLNRIRFPSPVPAGARIRARFKLQSFEEVTGGCQVVWLVTVEVESQPKPALVAEWVLRFYS